MASAKFVAMATLARINVTHHGRLVRIAAEAVDGHLSLLFPDGRELAGPVELGGGVTTNFWGRPVDGHLVEGPWSDALSDYSGANVRLVHTDEPGTGID